MVKLAEKDSQSDEKEKVSWVVLFNERPNLIIDAKICAMSEDGALYFCSTNDGDSYDTLIAIIAPGEWLGVNRLEGNENDFGKPAPSGIYFSRLPSEREIAKLRDGEWR